MRPKFPILAAVALSLSALAGWEAFVHFGKTGATEKKTVAAQRYVCPMRCLGKTYDHPGRCPVCHMELTLVADSHAAVAPLNGIEIWPRLDGKTAVYFRPYTVQKLQLDRVIRAAGPLSKDGMRLRVVLQEGEKDGLRRGVSAMVTPPSGYARPVLGSVSSLGPGSAVTITLSHALVSPDGALVEIRIPGPETLAVPLESLSEDSGETRVFVELQGRYEPRALKLGLRGERFAEVAAGLKEGDTVASSGLFWLEAQWRMDHSGKI